MASATCVECDEEIDLSGRTRLGMKVVCAQCGARLEVVNLAPVEVDWAFDDDEDDDWGDEEFDLDKDLDDEEDDDPFDDDSDLDDDDDWR